MRPYTLRSLALLLLSVSVPFLAQGQKPVTVHVQPGLQTGAISGGSFQLLEGRFGIAREQGGTQLGATATLGFYRMFNKIFPRNGEGAKYEGYGSDRLPVFPSATGLGLALHFRQAVLPSIWLQGEGSLRLDRVHNRIPSRGSSGGFNFLNGGGGTTYYWDSYWATGYGLAATLGYQAVQQPGFTLSPYIGISRTWIQGFPPFSTSVIGIQAAYALH